MKLNTIKNGLLATAIIFSLPTMTLAQEYQDIVRDGRGGPVVDMRDNCVYTKWIVQNDGCAGYPETASRKTQAYSEGTYMVFFDFDRATITPEASNILQTVAQNANSQTTPIELVGHADRSGSDSYNVQLSQRRANAVKKALVKLGVDGKRISTEARGERDPLLPTEDGVREPQNRRVEIITNK